MAPANKTSAAQAAAAAAAAPAKESPKPTTNVSASVDVEGNVPITSVQLDGLVVLKIIKNCREAFPAIVSGQLLGLDVNGVLEVTHSFPFPNLSNEDDNPFKNKNILRYQAEMLRCLRDVNVDNNPVGWYTSTYLGGFYNQSLVDNQYQIQQMLKAKSILLVHDVSRSAQGNISLRAFKLSPEFVETQKDGGKFTVEKLASHKLTFANILQELPIKIHNSHLLTALLYSLDESTLPSADTSSLNHTNPLSPNYDTLELSLDPYMEKNLEFLLDSVDEYNSEQSNLAYWQRSVAREQAKIQGFLSKRRAENAQRQAQGLKPLPAEEESEEAIARMFKLPSEPSRLESLLITAQMDEYCKQIEAFAGPTLAKMYAVNEIAGSNVEGRVDRLGAGEN